MDIINIILGGATIIVTMVILTLGYHDIKKAVEKYKRNK